MSELVISLVGLTSASAPALTAYCSSPRARALESFQCNGNALGTRVMDSLSEALCKSNFTLLKLSLYENVNGKEMVRRKLCRDKLEQLVLRNELLRRKVHEEAFALLSYARVLLFKSTQRTNSRLRHSASQLPLKLTRVPVLLSYARVLFLKLIHRTKSLSRHSAGPVSPFLALPTELQQHILTFLAPTLSAAQHARVFNYATNPSTCMVKESYYLILDPLLWEVGCLRFDADGRDEVDVDDLLKWSCSGKRVNGTSLAWPPTTLPCFVIM